VLKWARKKKCPWDSQTCSEAALAGHLDTLKWATENGCPWPDDLSSLMNLAAKGGSVEVAKWLQGRDVLLTPLLAQ